MCTLFWLRRGWSGSPKAKLAKDWTTDSESALCPGLGLSSASIMLGIMGAREGEVGRISGLCIKKSCYALCLVALLLKIEKALFYLNTQSFLLYLFADCP